MEQAQKQFHLPQQWLYYSLGILLSLGIFFRFSNLDLKPYWHDEIFTLLRVSGYQATEAVEQLFNGQVSSVDQLLQYQRPSVQGAIGTLRGLATEEPQHPPLYYLMAHFWATALGSSIAVTRALPALLSLLGFPALYWLCLELFGSVAIAAMATAFYAVSPIYIRYAQEARQYSLWLVVVIIASAMLLRAIRKPAWSNWLLYSLTVALSLYCHILSGIVIVGHGLYVLSVQRFNRRFFSYAIAALLGFAAFLPWLWIAWSNQRALTTTTGWMKNPLPFSTLGQFWGISLCRAFVSWHLQYNHQLIYLTFPVLALVAYAVYCLCRYTPRHVWLFVVILISIMIATLILPDVVFGGRRSTIDRYFLPLYLGIHLAVAYLLTAKSFNPFATIRERQLWRGLTVALISLSVITCAVSAQAQTWWGWSEFDVKIPQIINQSQQPLIISDMAIGNILPLAHRVQPDAKFLLIHDPNGLQIPAEFDTVYAYNPSQLLYAKIRQQSQQQQLVYQFQDPSTGLIISLYQILR